MNPVTGKQQLVDRLGVTSRKGKNSTLRLLGRPLTVSQRPKSPLGYPLVGVPDVVAGQVDVTPILSSRRV